MTTGPVATFSLAEPYQEALRMVRRALAKQGLRLAAELNVAERMKRELGAGVAPCIVLYVDDPALLLEAIVFDRGAALSIPHPIVVSGNHQRSEALIRSAESLRAGEIPASVRDPLLGLHARIVRALESVAEREEAHLMINH